MPNFDEESFPFILLSGANCASIVNVKDGFHQPLINQGTLGEIGAQTLFAKEEEYGISVHWTNKVENVDGKSKQLI